METQINQEQLIESLKRYVANDFWPRHRGLDQPTLLMLREADGKWEEWDIFLTTDAEDLRRNQILTSAMRQAVAKERPFAVSVVTEMRTATDDPHAHYDRVMATLEIRDEDERRIALFWDLGLDDCSIAFRGLGAARMVTLGNLYSGAEDCVQHWVYARNAAGRLTLLLQGGSYRSKAMTVRDIKLQTYAWLSSKCQRKLDKKKVLKSLVVAYRPLE